MSEWIYRDGKPWFVACENVAPLVNYHFARAFTYTEELLEEIQKC